VKLDDPLGDGQTQARAALGTRAGAVGLLELSEDLRLLLLGNPRPVSATETTNTPSTARASMATSPASVNLMALPTRLRSTWVMRPSSPLARGRSEEAVILSASFFSAAKDSTAAHTP
jgi:hypothetical protein